MSLTDTARRRLLVVTEHGELARLMATLVERELEGLAVEHVANATNFAAALSRGGFVAVVLDVSVTWADAADVAETLTTRYPSCPLLALAGEEARDWPAALLMAADDLLVGDLEACLELPSRLESILAAAERRRSEDVDDALTREAPVGLCTVSADGLVVDANLALAELLGFDESESLVGMSLDEFLDESKVRSDWHRLLELGGVLSKVETWARLRGGGRCWVRLSVWPLAGTARHGSRYAVLVEDLAGAKATEERLSASLRRLERVHADFEHFTYALSHDLQQPLQLIARTARLLVRREPSEDVESERLLGHIVAAADRMQAMIEGVLEYAAVGERDLEVESVDLSEVVEEAVEAIRPAVEGSDAKVTSEELPLVKADRAQMTRLFENLVGNAIKYRGEEDPRVHVSAVREGESWIVAVEDNGIGIGAGEQERIFEMFQRLHADSEVPGTGVGLAVCKRIVERHGGEIWVRSTPGEGSTFYVRLPDAPQSATANPHQRGEISDARADQRSAH